MNARLLPAPKPGRYNTTQAGRQALAALDSHRGRFVTITFVKRSTGELRTMKAIFSRRYLTVGRYGYDATRYGLVPVYDLEAGHVKMIPLDGIERLRAGGRTYSKKAVAPKVEAPKAIVADVDGTPFEDASRAVRYGLATPASERPKADRPKAPRWGSVAEATRDLADLF